MNFNEYTIKDLSFICRTEGNENMRLQLFTACGIIEGIPVIKDDINDSNPNAYLPQMILSNMEDYKKEYGENADTSNFILLQDVHIRNGNVITNCPSMVVFLDRIIGYTIGSLDK